MYMYTYIYIYIYIYISSISQLSCAGTNMRPSVLSASNRIAQYWY